MPLNPDEADAMVDEIVRLREMLTRSPWRETRRGNWCRRMGDGSVITIFNRHDEWHWLLIRDGEKQFSQAGYTSQRWAMVAAQEEYMSRKLPSKRRCGKGAEGCERRDRE